MLDGPRLRWLCVMQSVGGDQRRHGIIYSVMIMSPLTVMLCWSCSGPRLTDLCWTLVCGGNVSTFSRSGLHPGNPGPVSPHIFFNCDFLQLDWVWENLWGGYNMQTPLDSIWGMCQPSNYSLLYSVTADLKPLWNTTLGGCCYCPASSRHPDDGDF